MTKNEEYTAIITGYGSDGEGVCKIDGFAVFIPYALEGETVRIKILKALKNYAFGKIIEIIEPSPARVEPKCPHYYKCGGCGLMHMDYSEELRFKRQKVVDAITRIGGIPSPNVLETEASPKQTEYRNKVQFPVTSDGIGFYSQRSHRVVDIQSCMAQSPVAQRVVSAVRDYMADNNITPYDEGRHKGDIRHIFVRTAECTQEVLVCIVTRTQNLPHKDKLIEKLSFATGVVQNINSKKTNVVLGDKNILLHGTERITEKLCDITFTISPHSFFQINLLQTENLYAKAAQLAGLTGSEVVYDLYCGIGTIGLSLAKSCKQIVGVESVPQAVADAKENAARNGIKNAQFHLGNAEDILPRLIAHTPADIVIVDPPRKGCDPALIEAINQAMPEKIIYISCNPATLARDISLLKNSYEIKYVQPFDMFPRTPHVETVVLLSKLKSTTSIEVKIDLDEMDLTKSESRATYDEIKQYVLDKFGFKVSQLYIAQVKRKHGIIERDNYNIGESKAKVPQVYLSSEK